MCGYRKRKMKIETITSAQNPKVKTLLELQEKSRARRKEGLFVVEGSRELMHCLSAGYVAHTVFVCTEIIPQVDLDQLAEAVAASSEKCRFLRAGTLI